MRPGQTSARPASATTAKTLCCPEFESQLHHFFSVGLGARCSVLPPLDNGCRHYTRSLGHRGFPMDANRDCCLPKSASNGFIGTK